MQGALAGHTCSHIHTHPHTVHVVSSAALRYQWASWWMFQSGNQPLKRSAGRPREESRGEARSGQRPRKRRVTGGGVRQGIARPASPPYSTRPLRAEGCTPAGPDCGPWAAGSGRQSCGRMAQNSDSARPGVRAAGPASCEPGGPGPTRHHVHDLSHEAGQRRAESRRKQAWARDVAENNGHDPGRRRGTRLRDLRKRTSSHWCPDHPYLKPKQNTRFLSPLLLSLRFLPPPPAFQGDKGTWLKADSAWTCWVLTQLNFSIYRAPVSTMLTLPVTVQVGQCCWELKRLLQMLGASPGRFWARMPTPASLHGYPVKAGMSGSSL